MNRWVGVARVSCIGNWSGSSMMAIRNASVGRLCFPPGDSCWQVGAGVSVVEVGDAMRGESVTVVVQPSLGFKRGSGGAINGLWYFFFWPVYALLLGAADMVLAPVTGKRFHRASA